MAGLFDALQTATRGLTVTQRNLATTGHNIANVGTPGHSRLRTDQVSTERTGPSLVLGPGAARAPAGDRRRGPVDRNSEELVPPTEKGDEDDEGSGDDGSGSYMDDESEDGEEGEGSAVGGR